jgi:hypothetical protein
VNKNTIPIGRRCVKYKFGFYRKQTGMAHVVDCRYSQVSRRNFTDIYYPVVHDVTYSDCRNFGGMKLKWIDIETSFLYAEM